MSETHGHQSQSHSHTHAKANGAHPAADLESLRDSFVELRDDMGKLFEHVKGTARNGAGAVRNMASSAVDGMRERGEESVEKVSKKIEDNPLVSTAIAFGVGFILAKLLSHRD